MRLTSRGEVVFRTLTAHDHTRHKPIRWDGKWRVLIFDIPEYRKGLREKMRRTLTSIGFVRLQDSVWAYPYDCEDLVALLKADFKIGKDVLYLIVEEMEGDRHLRRHFNLHQL
ncbi:CRISPR-associated endonuclease Cas2 [Candidatus Kaiserbacteria bacterium]|nr:CRISPR-associated endonuclease Cas2 [Candidatus Kaiserbacteria bacterium]